MKLLGVFSGGLWIIPVGLLLAAIWTLIRGIKASNSQPMEYDGMGKLIPSKGPKIPVTKTTQFVFFVILLVAAIGSAIWMWSDK